MREGIPSGYMPKEEQEQAWKSYQDTALPGDKAQPVPGATLVVPRPRTVGYSPPASKDPLDAQYTELLRQRSEANSSQVAAAAGKATELNPDAAAKVVRLAADTGLPRDTVNRRTKEVEGQQRQLDERYFNQMTHPVIQEYLKDPYNAAITKDDPSFDILDKLLNSFTRSYHSTRASGTATANLANQRYISQLETVEQAEAAGKLDNIKDDADPLGFRFMTPEQRTSYRADLTGARAENLMSLEARNKTIAKLPGLDPTVAAALSAKSASEFMQYFVQKPVEFIVTIGAESAVQSAAIGATAYLSGGSIPITAAFAGAGSYGMDYGASIIEALRNEGVNLQDRGAIQKALEDKNLMKRVTQYAHSHAAPVALLDAISGGRTGGVRSLKGAALNQLEQGVAGATGEALGSIAAGKELAFGELAAEFLGEFVTAPIEASGALAATWQKHLQANEVRGFFTALGTTAEASKLRERMPEHMQELISKITADGPIENVYIEPRAFVQYFQSKNISPSVAAKQLFGDDAPLQQALAQGHDLEIPLGVYTAKLAGTEHNGPLSMDLKFNPTDLTVRETESLMEEARQQVTKDAAKAEGEESVGSIVSQSLQKAGHEKQTADLLAKQMESFFEAQAERTGRKSGLELFKEYAFRIIGMGANTKAGGLEIVQDQPAYHGSKHIFNKFDISKIGTGQGAQMHGWGMYFAKQKAVADINYRRKYGGLKIEGVSDVLGSALANDHITWVKAFQKARTDQHRLELLVEKDRHLRERRRAVIQRRVNAEKLLSKEGDSDSDNYRNSYAFAIKTLREEEMEFDQLIDEFQQLIERKGAGVKVGYGGRLYEVDIKVEDTEMLDLEATLDDQRAGFDRQIIADQLKQVQDKITADLLNKVKAYQDQVYDKDLLAGKEAERKVQQYEDNLAATTHEIDPKRLQDRYDNVPEPLTDDQVKIIRLAADLGVKVFGSKQEKDAALERLGDEFRKTYEGFGLKLNEEENQDIGRAAEDWYMNLTNLEDDDLLSQYNQRVLDERGKILRWINDFATRWEDAGNAKIQPAGYENTPIAKLLNNDVVNKVLDDYAVGYEAETPDTGRTLYKALVRAARDGMNEIYDALGQEPPTMHDPATVKIERFNHNREEWWHLTYWDENDDILWAGDATVQQVSDALNEEDFNELYQLASEVNVPDGGKESETVIVPWFGSALPEISKKVNKYRSPEEAASKFLLSQGIKGLNYVGGQDGPAMVVFDDSLIEITSYEQSAQDKFQRTELLAKEHGLVRFDRAIHFPPVDDESDPKFGAGNREYDATVVIQNALDYDSLNTYVRVNENGMVLGVVQFGEWGAGKTKRLYVEQLADIERGEGANLVEFLKKAAAIYKAKVIYLDANGKAVPAYEKLGFKDSGVSSPAHPRMYINLTGGPVYIKDSGKGLVEVEQSPFPKSKVKHKVYHGTAHDIDKFRLEFVGKQWGDVATGGFYFWKKPEDASFYAEGAMGEAWDDPEAATTRSGPNVVPVYINLENPKVITKKEAMDPENGYGAEAPTEVADMLAVEGGIDELKAAGHDGLIVRWGDQTIYVVFNEGQIKSAISGQMMQKTEDGPRGRMLKYGNYEYDIQLLETADLSTFLHESGHLYLEILWNLATEPDASPQVRKDFTAILQWLGAEPGKPLAYEQHEKFARGIEAYFMEGKAPSVDLHGAFARFRAWLMGVYKKLTDLQVRLNDDIREVMDRMFATEEAIAAAHAENILVPVFTTPEEASMTPDEFERYLKTIEKANIGAREILQTKLMNEWKREQTRWWDAQRALVVEEVRGEMVKDPAVVAYTLLRFGKDVNGAELADEQQIKLDREALIAFYGKDNPIIEQLRKFNLYRKEGGIAPDVAAEQLGFKSGDELVRGVLGAVDWKAQAEAQADILMKERYGDMLIDGTMADEATEAVNNYDRTKILHAELKALTKKRNEVAPFVQEERNRQRAERTRGLDAVRGVPSLEIFQRMAKQQIGLMPLRSISPNKFLVAARRAAVEAVDTATKGDYTTAARAKQQELFNMELYREARNAQRDVEKMLDFAKKMGTPAVRRRVSLAGGDFLDQIDAILERFEFKEVSALTAEKRLRLTEWIAQKERQGMTVDLPDYVVEEANRKPYRSLTLDEFKGVFDSLKHIDHMARLKNKLLKSKDKRELGIILAEVDATIRDSARKNDKSKLGKRLPQDETLRFIDSFFASHRKLASIIREMDGFKDGGPLWSLIMRPLNEAANSEAGEIHNAGQKLKDLFAPYVTVQEQLKSMATSATGGLVEYGMYKREVIPEINDSMSKMERIMVALNLGNEDNHAKIKAGYGWGDAQISAILKPLTKEDWDFIQGIWDFVDSYWPQIQAKEKRVKGIAPERVEPTPVNTPFGVYKGGYFPLKYEERSPGGQRAYGDRAREAAEMMMKGAYTQATTRRGHTKERVEGVRMPVRLDFGVIYEHVHQVVHDLTHHEALIDANKVVGARQTQIAIVESYGDIVYDQIRHALEAVAAGEIPAHTAFEKSVNWLRHGVSIAAMGWNLMTSLLQPLGLSQSIVRIGAPWVFKGAMRTLGDATRFESTAKWVHAKSDFMKNRHTTLNREINEIRNQMKGELGVTGNSFFWLIAMGQRVADFPTWVGMYEKQMAGGKDEEIAIALADQAVLDSQGGGQVKDLAQIQRGTPLMKLWTNFYSYFNVTYNMTAESYRRTSFKSPTQIAALAVDLLFLYTVPAVLGFMMKEVLRDDPPEEDLMKRLAAEQAGYIFGTMAGFREFSSVIQGYYGYEGPAGTRFYSEMAQFMKQAQQAEWDEALWKSINNTAGIVLHYPAGQVQRTVDGYVAWTEDRASPMAIVVGPPKEK